MSAAVPQHPRSRRVRHVNGRCVLCQTRHVSAATHVDALKFWIHGAACETSMGAASHTRRTTYYVTANVKSAASVWTLDVTRCVTAHINACCLSHGTRHALRPWQLNARRSDRNATQGSDAPCVKQHLAVISVFTAWFKSNFRFHLKRAREE